MNDCDLTLKIPSSNKNERLWIANIILSRISDSYRIEFHDESDWEISINGIHKKIFIKDFFLRHDLFVNHNIIIPKKSLGKLLNISENFNKYYSLPVLYGDNIILDNSNSTFIGIDIFGSAFMMLSRYEEYFCEKYDKHDRVLSSELIAVKYGFAERPIIDEYVDLLSHAIQAIQNSFNFKKNIFKINLSHDVDNPSRYEFLSFLQTLRAIAGDLLVNKKTTRAIKGALNYLHNNKNIKFKDEYNNFDWIMDCSESYGISSTFNFIAGKSELEYDPSYCLDAPEIRVLLKKIHIRGHKIGLHPSYKAYKDYDILNGEFLKLNSVLSSEGIKQKLIDSRMHYLRWRFPQTLQICEKVGIKYENSLGFSDRAGFRCGTANEYPAYDLQNRKEINLIIRPLIAMECSVISNKYMGLGLTPDAFDYLKGIKDLCKKFRGNFSLLWHNTELISLEQKEFYQQILKA